MESGTKDDGWKSVAAVFGVHVWSKASEEGTTRLVCRGQVDLPAEVTLEMITAQFVKAYNNSTMLAQQMRYSGKFGRNRSCFPVDTAWLMTSYVLDLANSFFGPVCDSRSQHTRLSTLYSPN